MDYRKVKKEDREKIRKYLKDNNITGIAKVFADNKCICPTCGKYTPLELKQWAMYAEEKQWL